MSLFRCDANLEGVKMDDWEKLNREEHTGGYELPETEEQAQASYVPCPNCGAMNLSTDKECWKCKGWLQ